MAWYHDYGDKWNAHDAGGVVAFMTSDAVYEDLALGARHVGHDDIRGFIDGMSDRISSDYAFEFAEPIASTDEGYALEWVMRGTTTVPAVSFRRPVRPFRSTECRWGA